MSTHENIDYTELTAEEVEAIWDSGRRVAQVEPPEHQSTITDSKSYNPAQKNAFCSPKGGLILNQASSGGKFSDNLQFQPAEGGKANAIHVHRGARTKKGTMTGKVLKSNDPRPTKRR